MKFSDMDPILAKLIALGDADPVTGLPMNDINPDFAPRILKPLPLVANSASQSAKNKGKGRESLPTGGILSFFGSLSFLFSISDSPITFMLCRSKSRHTSTCEAEYAPSH